MVTVADFDRFHLGCGPDLVPAYLNIDAAPERAPNRICKFDKAGAASASLLNYDLRGGPPGADGSLAVLYRCHFLEHLTRGGIGSTGIRRTGFRESIRP